MLRLQKHRKQQTCHAHVIVITAGYAVRLVVSKQSMLFLHFHECIISITVQIIKTFASVVQYFLSYFVFCARMTEKSIVLHMCVLEW